MKPRRWTRCGRLFSHADEGKPNTFTYKSKIGQRCVDLGKGDFAPYVWDSPNQGIRYGSHWCQFFDWYQVVRDENKNILIDDQRFEVQQWQGNRWRVVDLFNREIIADQQDDRCVVTRRHWDNEGNELIVNFLFRPSYKVKLTFELKVQLAGQYRIRFQNTGIAGELIERKFIDRERVDRGLIGLLFEKIRFCWDRSEIGIHSYTVETQAKGKKLDIFLGSFDLPANGSVIISADTWGTDVGIDDNVDDGDEYTVYTYWWWNGYVGGQISMGWESNYLFHVGCRWDGLSIPQGSTINSCVVDLYQTTDFSGTPSGYWYAWDIADAPQFADSGDRPSNVTKTTAKVEIVPNGTGLPKWTNWILTSICQEIINSYDTASINFFIFADAAALGEWAGFEDYSAAGTNEAELTITYTPPAAGLGYSLML